MTNWNKRHHYKQSSEYPNECICGLPFGNPLHIQPKQPKLKQSMKLKTSMEVEEILFELHTRFCPLVDTEDNPIKQRHCNMVKNELRKAINSEIEKAREEILIPFDDKPTFGGLINFASNAPEETDISFAKKQAFDYGFRLGWQICYREFLSKLKSLKQK